MVNRQKSKSKVKDIVLRHISNNIKQYIIVALLFTIGIIIGILLIKNSSIDTKIEINEYLNDFTKNLKDVGNIDKNKLLLTTMKSNLKITILMWFMGSTVIGIPAVLGIIIFKGVCIGYTVSSLIGVFGIKSGTIITFLSIFIQNLVLIPAILAIGVSGINLYKVITKNRHRENVKMEILRHTVFCVIMLALVFVSCFIESFISPSLIEWYVKI